MTTNNPLQRLKDVQKLNSVISEHQQKLDRTINEAINHMINYSQKINDNVLPSIPNKKIAASTHNKKQSKGFTRDLGVRSVRTKSFLQQSTNLSFTDTSQLDNLINVYRNKTIRRQFKSITQPPIKEQKSINRPIGSYSYVKPHHIKKNPEILPKEIRCNPFSEKNAIKANQLDKGMLHLLQSGKVGPNIDIITAFQKGRPILESHQAIVHQAEEKFAFAQLERGYQKQKKNRSSMLNKSNQPPNYSSSIKIENYPQYTVQQIQNNWAITMPEEMNNINKEPSPRKLNNNKNTQQDLEDPFFIQFHHSKLIKNKQFLQIKRRMNYYQNWGNVIGFLKIAQKYLSHYKIDFAYINSKKMLNIIHKKYSLNKITKDDISQCLVHKKTTVLEKNCQQSLFNLHNIINLKTKAEMAAIKIQAAFKKFRIRKKFIKIIHRKKIESKIKEWALNGKLIKQYRKSLITHFSQTKAKFQQQQHNFRLNYPTIQSSKHFQIHIPNKEFMNGFKYNEEMNNTQITRIFNLQNPQTHLIYICPWEISIETINYYFKIMELQEIQNYQDRVTFIELNSQLNKVILPQNLNTSSKLYYNSKVLRKLKQKIGDTPSYFVINEPTETDIRLSSFLGIPIFNGNSSNLNLSRSILSTKQFVESLPQDSIQTHPSLSIHPKTQTVLSLSNMIMRYCESNKDINKFIMKINGRHQSSGLALITYPFTSLPELYSNTALTQHFYYKTVEKYYIDFIKKGGVVQRYQEGIRTITVSGRILHDHTYTIMGTFQRISSGFVNIAYIFPQKIVPHKMIAQKCKPLFEMLVERGHFGGFQLTIMIDIKDRITLDSLQLYHTKITNSLSYFKFLAGGYFNHLGEFITKITGDQTEDQQIVTMEPRGFCYMPFILHFGLSQKQTMSFFQLCRIGGVSFDLENKFGSTFILLGSMKNCIGIITSAKDKKMSTRLMSKTLEFLLKQNSHNISNQMLQEKQLRIKERLNILSLKQRIQSA